MSLVQKNINWFPSVLDEFFNPDWLGGVENSTLDKPAVNIKESDTDFVLELMAPGRKKDTFTIEVNKGVLTVSSEEKINETSSLKNYTRREFRFSAFKRTFKL